MKCPYHMTDITEMLWKWSVNIPIYPDCSCSVDACSNLHSAVFYSTFCSGYVCDDIIKLKGKPYFPMLPFLFAFWWHCNNHIRVAVYACIWRIAIQTCLLVFVCSCVGVCVCVWLNIFPHWSGIVKQAAFCLFLTFQKPEIEIQHYLYNLASCTQSK